MDKNYIIGKPISGVKPLLCARKNRQQTCLNNNSSGVTAKL